MSTETELVLSGEDSLAALNKSEIDIQIATAKRYPRSIKEFHAKAMELATLDEDTAASMFYKLPRGGKAIEGPSVRLAEIVASTYKNLRAESRIVAIDANFITAQGSAIDLENNYAARTEVKRRITDKYGKRFNDDMIAVTSNAAASIALREAIFKVIPRALVKPVYDKAKAVAIGDAKSIVAKRTKAFEWFAKVGGTQDAVLAKLGRKGVEDVTLDDLELLQGMLTAIRDGEISIEDALRVDEPETQAPTTRELNDIVKKAAKKSEPAPEPIVEQRPPLDDDLPNLDVMSDDEKAAYIADVQRRAADERKAKAAL